MVIVGLIYVLGNGHCSGRGRGLGGMRVRVKVGLCWAYIGNGGTITTGDIYPTVMKKRT